MIDSINGAVKRVLVRGLLFCMGLLLVVSTVLENGHAAVRIPPKSLQNNVAADLLKTQKTTPRTGLSEVHVFGDDPGQGNLTVPSGLEGAIAVGAGRQHYLVVKPDGSVETWGTGWNGQTSPPAGLTGVIEVAGGDTFSLALKNDGTVVAWGDMAHWTSATEYLTDTFDDAFVPAGLVDVAHIYAHSQLAIALKSNGTIVQWGVARCTSISYASVCPDAMNHSLVLPPEGLTNVIDVAIWGSSTNARVAALRSDGTVVRWGSTLYDADFPTTVAGAQRIALGESHGILLTDRNTVVTWGKSDTQQAKGLALVFSRQPATPFTHIVAGRYHNYLVAGGGTSIAKWGDEAVGTQPVVDSARVITAFRMNDRNGIFLSVPPDSVQTQTLTPTSVRTLTPTSSGTLTPIPSTTHSPSTTAVLPTITHRSSATASQTRTTPRTQTKSPTAMKTNTRTKTRTPTKILVPTRSPTKKKK